MIVPLASPQSWAPAPDPIPPSYPAVIDGHDDEPVTTENRCTRATGVPACLSLNPTAADR